MAHGFFACERGKRKGDMVITFSALGINTKLFRGMWIVYVGQ